VPMRIYPAPHYTMGGLWVDYNLQSTIPGLFVIGEANFSDHGANRLGASALMQGLADGYFVIPYTIGNYLAPLLGTQPLPTDHDAFVRTEADVMSRIRHVLEVNGSRSASWFHKELGKIMIQHVGMARSEEGLTEAIGHIRALRDEFHRDMKVLGTNESFNQALANALRVWDFFELAELMAIDALHRRESCGGHFRLESQTEDGEALRDDENFAYVAAWEFKDVGNWELHKEPLEFEYVALSQRSYK